MTLIDLREYVDDINRQLGERGRIDLKALSGLDRLVIEVTNQHGGGWAGAVQCGEDITDAIDRMAESLGPVGATQPDEPKENPRDLFEQWRERTRKRFADGVGDQITDFHAGVMLEATNAYGPANNWTGTTGTLAAMIRELLTEREMLLVQLESMERGKVSTQKVTCESLVAAGWIEHGNTWTRTVGNIEVSAWMVDGRWYTDGGLDDVLIPATSIGLLAQIESDWQSRQGVVQ